MTVCRLEINTGPTRSRHPVFPSWLSGASHGPLNRFEIIHKTVIQCQLITSNLKITVSFVDRRSEYLLSWWLITDPILLADLPEDTKCYPILRLNWTLKLRTSWNWSLTSLSSNNYQINSPTKQFRVSQTHYTALKCDFFRCNYCLQLIDKIKERKKKFARR